MALTDEPVGLAASQQRLETRKARLRPRLQCIKLCQVGFFADQRANLLEILYHWGHHAFRRAEFTFGPDLR